MNQLSSYRFCSEIWFNKVCGFFTVPMQFDGGYSALFPRTVASQSSNWMVPFLDEANSTVLAKQQRSSIAGCSSSLKQILRILDGKPPRGFRRIVITVLMCFATFCTAGVIIGFVLSDPACWNRVPHVHVTLSRRSYAQLEPLLRDTGVYSDLCHQGTSDCNAQKVCIPHCLKYLQIGFDHRIT